MLFIGISPRHQIIALIQLVNEPEHLLRGILPIVIHTYYNITGHMVVPRHQRRVLSKVPGQRNNLNVMILRCKLAEHLQRIVRRIVVDADNLIVIASILLHRALNPCNHVPYGLRRPITRNYKRKLQCFYFLTCLFS